MWPSLEVRSIHVEFGHSLHAAKRKTGTAFEWMNQISLTNMLLTVLFSFERVVKKRVFRVPGYHQPTMACLGQAVQSPFLNRSDVFHQYSTCSYTRKFSQNVKKKSLKVSIKNMLTCGCCIIPWSSQCTSFTSLAPGRPSLVGAVASVRVARWGFGMKNVWHCGSRNSPRV